MGEKGILRDILVDEQSSKGGVELKKRPENRSVKGHNYGCREGVGRKKKKKLRGRAAQSETRVKKKRSLHLEMQGHKTPS